jgi:hypothetical protein
VPQAATYSTSSSAWPTPHRVRVVAGIISACPKAVQRNVRHKSFVL